MSSLSGDEAAACAQALASKRLLAEAGLLAPQSLMLVSGPTLKHTPPTVALDFLWKPPGAAPSAPAPLTAQAGSIGIALQALVLGSCLQLITQYFRQPTRDSAWGRVGVIWSVVIALANALTGNIANGLLILNSDDFTAAALRDWNLYQLSFLWVNLIHFPLLLLFTRRAWVMWERRRWVLVVCLVPTTAMFAMTLAGSAYGLQAPWGHRNLTQAEFEAWIPTFLSIINAWKPLRAAAFLQLGACALISSLICAGVLRHRNGVKELDSAISRIVFVCGESLLPMVILSTINVAVICIGGNVGFLVTRALALVCPTVVLHALLTSLVSRERVAAILRAEPVRNLTPYTATSSKSPGLLDPSEFTSGASSDYTSVALTYMSETGRGDSFLAVPMLTSTGSVGSDASRWAVGTDLESKEKEGDSGLVGVVQEEKEKKASMSSATSTSPRLGNEMGFFEALYKGPPSDGLW